MHQDEKTTFGGYVLREGEKLVQKDDCAIVFSGDRPSKLVYQDGRVIPFNH